MNPNISLIGAPTDIGAGSRGASMGPEALRVANIVPVLEGHGLQVQDRGNLNGPRNPWLPPVDGYRHLEEVAAWNQSVHDAVYAELQLGRLPILLGGDHCLGLGSISAVARHCRDVGKKLRVLWLDAHADFNTSALTPSGNIHGMPVACLCGYGPDVLTRIGGQVPATTVRGGPTYREAQLCMEMIADTGRLASLDVMELNPAFDVRNKTAEVAVDLIESLFGKSTLMRKASP
jgi:arginase